MVNKEKGKTIILSFYLPQYHPIKENDEWWGKGFTEWTNVGRAKPLFKKHEQPKIPADLGYYDLRLSEVRAQQAYLAAEAGITGFCYWHYWFNGKRLMNQVFDSVLKTQEPDFPFCLFWANHSWYAKNWNSKDSNGKHRLLIEQTYPGKEDYINHFNFLLEAFKDRRYIKIENKPVFGLYNPVDIPDINEFKKIWNDLAIKNGFNGIYFIGFADTLKKLEKIKTYKFDAVTIDVLNDVSMTTKGLKSLYRRAMSRLNLDSLLTLTKIPYAKYTGFLKKTLYNHRDTWPCILPNYDHTPRSGRYGTILTNSTPENWNKLLIEIKEIMNTKSEDQKFIFIKSWNEWGEGNYLEPDLKYGKRYLTILKDVLGSNNTSNKKS